MSDRADRSGSEDQILDAEEIADGMATIRAEIRNSSTITLGWAESIVASHEALRALVATREQERDEARRSLEDAHTTNEADLRVIRNLETALEATEQRVAELETALAKYAKHLAPCALTPLEGTHRIGARCTCGLTALLGAAVLATECATCDGTGTVQVHRLKLMCPHCHPAEHADDCDCPICGGSGSAPKTEEDE